MSKILICDDSSFMLTLFSRGLTANGLTIAGKALSADECIALYKTLKPDLVLLDITMPNKDGRDCLKEILQFDPKAQVIMVTAVGDANVKAECLALGAKYFLPKSQLTSPAGFTKAAEEVFKPLLAAKRGSVAS